MPKTIIVKCNLNQKDTLWNLFKEYHFEVSSFAYEQALPEEELFKSFWFQSGKEVLFLVQDEKIIGFTLLQAIQNERNEHYLEMGAVFVQKVHRGFHSLQLYKAAMKRALELRLRLTSEIAMDNTLSLGIFDSLTRRYATKSNFNFKKIKMKNSRYFVSAFLYVEKV